MEQETIQEVKEMDKPLSSYEQRKQAKIEYAIKRSAELTKSSDAFFNKSFCETTGIPMGQPILLGHHSEARHRRAIERYDNHMRKNIEDADKAKYYEEKAKRLEDNTVISSDDPDAVNKLKDKLSQLEARREAIKLKNKQFKKEGLDKLPAYVLSNLAGNIKSVKDRIQHLESLKAIPELEETINGVVLKTDKEANRVKLFFEGIPKEEIRTKLKHNGFRWSPFNRCWQAYLNKWNIVRAREILNVVN